MEVCVPCYTSICRDVISDSGSSVDPHIRTDYCSSDLSLSDLKASLDEYLNGQEDEIRDSGVNLSPTKNDLDNLVTEDECNDSDKAKSSNSASEKSLVKSATFPPLGEPKCSVNGLVVGKKEQEGDKTAGSEVNGGSCSASQCYVRSVSLPTPLKIVSAMKGSREKQGLPPKKLSVTWAPDVYDPIPTSVSHVPSSRNQRGRHNGRKYGKNKQNGGGKSSRGGKGKDKKQVRKNSTGANKLRPLHEEIGVVALSEPQASILDFHIGGSPDPFCGSSFLKKSVTNLHFPVTEAT